MGNELARTQTNNCTLYEIEDTLAAFVSTIDLAPDDATRLLVLDEIGQALRKAKEKRDGVVAFLRHCEEQQEFAMPKSNASSDARNSSRASGRN
jgi:hypothetical protein